MKIAGRFLLAAALLAGTSLSAIAQTKPTLPRTSVSASGASVSGVEDVRTVLGAKCDVDASGCTVTIGGVTQPLAVWFQLGATVNGVSLWLNPNAASQNTTYAAGGLTNGVLVAAGGNRVSYCPVLSCVTSPSADHQRASALFWATTSDDGHSEEQTVAIQTIVNTGEAKNWAPSTSYAVGDNVSLPAGVYRATTAGVSAGSGAGPIGTGSNIVDGAVRWSWINEPAINAKLGIYNEVQLNPGGGAGWGMASNVQMMPGYKPRVVFGNEVDLTNNSGTDCVPGSATCIALQIFMGGNNYSTAAIGIAPNIIVGASQSSLFGLFINGRVARSADLEIDGDGSQVGLAFGRFIAASHSIATITDNTTSPTSILISGVHAHEVIGDTSTSGAAINASGTYSLAALRTVDATTSNALIAKDGQKVCFSNTDACLVHSADTGKLYYQVGGISLFSIADTTGNAVFKGSVTSNGTP